MAPTDEDSTADDGFAERWGDPEDRWRPEKRWEDPEERWSTNRDTDEEDGDVPDFSDVDSELVTTFAVSVILTNAALLALSLGLMLAYFRGRYQLGGALFVGGVLLLLRVYQYYRQFRRDRERDEEETNDAAGSDESVGNAGDAGDARDAGDAGDAPRND